MFFIITSKICGENLIFSEGPDVDISEEMMLTFMLQRVADITNILFLHWAGVNLTVFSLTWL